MKAQLVLEDGSVFEGHSFGAPLSTSGECVFQTGMVGYPESLTDPSYRGQILVLSYPIIGNYGVAAEEKTEQAIMKFLESDEVHVRALVVGCYSERYSHWNASSALSKWLAAKGVTAITDIDTRAVIKCIREKGSMLGKILVEGSESDVPFYDPNRVNLAQKVSTSKVLTFGNADAAVTVLAVDFGIKHNQLRELVKRGLCVKLVPYSYDLVHAAKIKRSWEQTSADEQPSNGEYFAFDAIFLSNGPGDPSMLSESVQGLSEFMKDPSLHRNRPVFGICMGNLVMARAAGLDTHKMKYGHRGHNQPCTHLDSGLTYITSQNHGYAVDNSALHSVPAPALPRMERSVTTPTSQMLEASASEDRDKQERVAPDWEEWWVNVNDGTNEGIRHRSLPFFAVQFHPEACSGPNDSLFLFDVFQRLAQGASVKDTASQLAYPNALFSTSHITPPSVRPNPSDVGRLIKKVLLLGSGGLTIGQAGEFDYSGSQALKALREEGVSTVLINPNIATVQTSQGMADKTYFLPVTPEFVHLVIENERPDGILVTFGGQTALNCGIKLHRSGILEEFNVAVLGTPIDTIVCTEDREVFAQKMSEINEKVAPSFAAVTVEEAVAHAKTLSYPVILRAAFALGGLGSGFADNEEELRVLATKAFATSPQVLIERSMRGWKEIEYEVVRDAYDNTITVCNMENFDPLGIHTGESIVVAPSQTLTDQEYQMLRDTAVRTVRHLGVIGECNIQYALHPQSLQYCIIEVNARLSRSSALASKATGYPLAAVAARLALGHSLPSLKNSVTECTTACFEPSLDYVVVKTPRWDLQKFLKVDQEISTSMKSVGEVMAIGRCFEEVIQKAVRMVNSQSMGFIPYAEYRNVSPSDAKYAEYVEQVEKELCNASPARIFFLAAALALGLSVDRIHELTFIDRWFLYKLENITNLRSSLREYVLSESDKTKNPVSSDLLVHCKKYGFSDVDIAHCLGSTEGRVREYRLQHNIIPFIKQIDTVAAEFPAQNNYLYLTFNASEHDVVPETPVIVLGSGPYCIGSSVEFDWCCVECIKTLREKGHTTAMINCNPETVSTDYDECDALFFDEISFEVVFSIYQLTQAHGVVVSMGGQLPNNICLPLSRADVTVLGTSPEMIDRAENRYKFSRMLDRIGIDQPKWRELTSVEDARAFCSEVGKAIIRPSYVLSGAAMTVCHTLSDVDAYFESGGVQVSKDHPVVVSHFISGAKEIEMDAVAIKGEVVAYAISEHVENAGVHSGDATLICPPQGLCPETTSRVVECTKLIASALRISGPMNVQFIAKDNDVKVIECNVRSSRSFPFVSKTLGLNLIRLATRILCESITMADIKQLVSEWRKKEVTHVGVKCAQFSFARLVGADPVSGVEMASTGEVACFGRTKCEAYLKSLVATGFRLPLPPHRVLLSIGPYAEKVEFLPFARKLVALGFDVAATPGTGDYLNEHGVKVSVVEKDALSSAGDASGDSLADDGTLRTQLVINLPSNNRYRRPSTFSSQGYQLRRSAVENSVSLITNIKCAKLLVDSLVWASDKGLLKGRNDRGELGWKLSLCDEVCSSRIVRLPGLVDPHVHLREPGGEHKETFYTGTCAALAGGFTMVCAMPNTQPSVIDEASLDVAGGKAEASCVCDYSLFCGASATNAEELYKISDRCAALKMYLNHTFTTLRLPHMHQWMEHFKHLPRSTLICTHAENRTMGAVLSLAMMYDRPLHICHLSLKDEILMVKEAKARGVKVTCEVAPHHLFLDDDDIDALGAKKAVCPALATAEDRQALWDNLDVIDMFASDHAPHTREEKSAESPPPGFPGLETTLPLLLTAVSQGKLTLEDVILRCHTNPIKIFNLPQQPNTYIEVDLDKQWTIPTAMPFSKCQWTPFEGKQVRGQVRKVVLRGELVYCDGRILAPEGYGMDLRSPSYPSFSSALPPSPVLSPSVPDDELIKSPLKPLASPSLPAHSPPDLDLPSSMLGVVEHRENGSSLAAVVSHAQQQMGLSHSIRSRHIISVHHFSRNDLHHLFQVTEEIRSHASRAECARLLPGYVLGTLFYEPSSRTYASFSAAMQRLGGSVVPIHSQTSSAKKGESILDSVRTIASYCDGVILRHPEKGSVARSARVCEVPLINAGDGDGEHPTQALLDVFTIRDELGTVNGVRVMVVGDLLHSRTVHSFVHLLTLYKNIFFVFVSPKQLRMPAEILDRLREQEGCEFVECENIHTYLPTIDVMYLTRTQRERFSEDEDVESAYGCYVVTPRLLSEAKKNMIVMHALPRLVELSEEVDTDPRAAYFRQMKNGMYVRMALLAVLLHQS